MSKLQEALDLVEQLEPAERQQLLDHLALRRKTGQKSQPVATRDNELWLGEVADALGRVLQVGDRSSPTLAVIKRTQGDHWPSVADWMVRSGLQSLTVSERVAAYRILAQLLVRHAEYVARKSGAPLGPKLVFNCVGNLPGLFEDAFPGYLANGLAKVLVRRLVKN